MSRLARIPPYPKGCSISEKIKGSTDLTELDAMQIVLTAGFVD